MKNENLLTMPSMTISDSQLEELHDRELKRKFFPKGISLVANGINQVHKFSPYLSSKLTMNLLSVAIRKRVKKKDKLFYQKGKKEIFTYNNKKFNVYTYGNGPKVLFIHGWASNGARWKNYVEKIVAKGFTAVIVDAPAQGTSNGFLLSVPDYIQCIKTVLFAKENWYGIVSHSVGSLVGVIAASESKIEFDKLKFVMMCTFSDCDALMTKYARCMGIKEQVLSDTKSKIDQIYYESLTHFSLVDHFKKIKATGFLIFNPDDIVVPSAEGNKIRRALPSLRFLETREGGHNLRSERVEEEVIKFLDR